MVEALDRIPDEVFIELGERDREVVDRSMGGGVGWTQRAEEPVQ